ncbi:MAG: hypothetical protein IT553_04905 [Sphingomonadaceae bacterium]|nr:hypothetical protein [Sphingomonadaceae bacterium]
MMGNFSFKIVATRRTITMVLGLLAWGITMPAHAEWREATSEHFIVESDGSEAQLVRTAQRLEAVHWMLTQLTGVNPGNDAQRVRIVLVSNIAQVHGAMRVGNEGVGANNRAAGFYRPAIDGAVAVVPRSEGDFSTVILYHEYAHHFMLQYLQRVYPPWLVEGFAEFVSTASFETTGQISIGRPAQHRAAELDYDEWVPIDRMLERPSASDRRAGVASYGQYWLTAHYFIMDAGRRRQLNDFLNAWSSGTDYNQALARLTAGEGSIDGRLRAYLRNRRFAYTRLPLPEHIAAPPVVRVMTPGEAAVVPISLLRRGGLDTAEQADYLAQLAPIYARFPNDAEVNLLRAQAYFDFEKWPEAIAAADQVLAVVPNHQRAIILRARAAIHARSDESRDISAAEASALRRPIINANRANPNDPAALLGFAESFDLLHQPTVLSAVQAWVRASELVPQIGSLRMTAVRNLLSSDAVPREERLAIAQRLLVPLAYAPHQSDLQAYALTLMQWVESGAEGDPPTFIPMPRIEGVVGD